MCAFSRHNDVAVSLQCLKKDEMRWLELWTALLLATLVTRVESLDQHLMFMQQKSGSISFIVSNQSRSFTFYFRFILSSSPHRTEKSKKILCLPREIAFRLNQAEEKNWDSSFFSTMAKSFTRRNTFQYRNAWAANPVPPSDLSFCLLSSRNYSYLMSKSQWKPQQTRWRCSNRQSLQKLNVSNPPLSCLRLFDEGKANCLLSASPMTFRNNELLVNPWRIRPSSVFCDSLRLPKSSILNFCSSTVISRRFY